MMRVFVEGVGLLGPGLCGWEAGRGVLAGQLPYVPAPAVMAASSLLPPAERRRCVPTVRLAMAVGAEALAGAGRDPVEVATVFTSSSGDPDTLHNILETLASADRELSPTRFHNSVHNAPAGYWSIATGCREPSTSLCRDEESFQAGLLEAVTQVVVDRRVVALIAYDLPYPEPLAAVRRIVAPLGIAVVLAPERTERTIAELEVTLSHGSFEQTRMADAGLETLRTGNPAGRGLPLLAALARTRSDSIELELGPRSHIAVEVMPSCR